MALVSVSVLPLLLVSLGLLVAKVVYDIFLSPLRHFNGPFLARWTDAYRALLTAGGFVDHHKRAWHRRWGTAVRVGPNTISIGDPELLKVIYTTKSPWIKSDMYRPNDVVVGGKRIPNIFNTPDEAFHAKYTKPIGGFWTQTKILELEPLMDETLRLLVDTLDRRFAKDGTVCMMDEWLAYHAWDAAANVSFGKHYGFIEKGHDIEGIIAESTAGLKYFAPVSQMPWIDDWLDKNPVWRIGPRPLVNGFLYTVKLLSEYQKQLDDGTATHRGVDTFLEKYNGLEKTVDFVDHNQVINWLMLNVLAGGDSTAGALRSVVYHLARNPSVQAKLVAELDAAATGSPVAEGSPPQWKSIKPLAYLDAVMWEAQRVSPALGLILERWTPAGGLQLPDGRVVPAGTKVGISPCVVTRDVGLFGEDVEAFRPERWLQRDGEDVDSYATRRRRMAEAADFMFGTGNRVCMGKHMAKTIMYKLIATLYSEFDVRFEKPGHEWKYFNAWFMYQSDMPMVLERRHK